MERLYLLLVFLVSALRGAHAQSTPCSPGNRLTNMEACLSAIRSQATDKINGPYGAAYFERCPFEGRDHINCFETDPIFEPKSLSELTFMVADQDLSTVDRFLAMEYTSHAGEYTGCGHTYNYPNEKSFHIDPLAGVAFPSWDLRDSPVSTWDYVEGELFTLVLLEPLGATKSVAINIEGNDFTNAVRLVPYNGPTTHQNTPRPFTFSIYKQPNRLTPQTVPSHGFNVTAFAERNQLQGPVAFSWLLASYDAYSVERYRFGQNCASLVQDALQPLLTTFDIMPSPNEINLRVLLHVEYVIGPITYSCGNYSVNRPANNVVFDPIKTDALIDTADLRTESLKSIHLEMNKIDPHPSDFVGKLYTILHLNPETKHLYGMMVNLADEGFTAQGVEASAGDIIQTYQQPNPPNDGNMHPLMFLVYEQTCLLPANLDPTPYLVTIAGNSGNRHIADLAAFVADHQLDLVGASLMHVRYDEYTRCTTTQA